LLSSVSIIPPGIHLVHKPVGPSSFAVLREFLGAAPPSPAPPKACHGGALDPFSSGLLLVLIDPATKLFDYLHDAPKTYEATLRWGVETDNDDPTGKVIATGDASNLDAVRLEAALGRFVGWHDQVPPATSNKRIGGERAYLKAHRGEAVELPPSRVYLHEARWLSHDLPRESRLRVVVRGGYYVRALARDLGRLAGCGAHLSALHRSSIGPWHDPGPGEHGEIHGRGIVPWMKTRVLTDQEVGELRAGRDIAIDPLEPPAWPLPPGFTATDLPIRGFHLGRFAFLLREADGRLASITHFAGTM
jgi:tRNA pseudouridine55 synthase